MYIYLYVIKLNWTFDGLGLRISKSQKMFEQQSAEEIMQYINKVHSFY